METPTEQVLQEWNKLRDELRVRLVTTDELDKGDLDAKYVAGVDISFIPGDEKTAVAGYVICQLPGLEVVYEDVEVVTLAAPYIPGYLAFREADPLAKLIEKQRAERPELGPDYLIVDGNGLLHYHKFGLACHLGVLVDLPTFGVAKNLFQMNDLGLLRDDEHQRRIEALKGAGDSFELKGTGDEVLGLAVKTCESATKPVFVSIGHKVSLKTALKVTVLCSKFRVPEPTRQADMKTREHIRQMFGDKWKERKESAKKN